jgi:hypothetical protein
MRQRRRVYDHRIRQMVAEGDDPTPFAGLVPRSTLHSWRTRALPEVVTLEDGTDERDAVIARLTKRVRALERVEQRYTALLAIVRLLFALGRVVSFRLDETRLPEGAQKASILAAIQRTAAFGPAQRRPSRLRPLRFQVLQLAETQRPLPAR